MRIYFLLFTVLLSSFSAESLSLKNRKKLIDIETLKSRNTKVIEVFKEKESQQFVAFLPNGTVINEGGILTEGGYILKTTQTSFSDQHNLRKPNRDINQENPLFFKGKLAVISSPGSENWYHWLLQILPRLLILKQAQAQYDRIYINNLTQPWQKESLKIILSSLKIPEDKLLIINGDCIIQAEMLIVPSVPFIPRKDIPLPSWLKKELRAVFLGKDSSPVKKYERIYISREKASSRRILNEKDLIKSLRKLDFHIVDLETLSPHEQAHLFYNARVIVGPHGSGFANLLFVKPHCKLIEIDHKILPPRSVYEKIAQFMCSSYYPFFVDQTTKDRLDDDMTIDVDEFLKFIKKIISLKNVYLCSNRSLYA